MKDILGLKKINWNKKVNSLFFPNYVKTLYVPYVTYTAKFIVFFSSYNYVLSLHSWLPDMPFYQKVLFEIFSEVTSKTFLSKETLLSNFKCHIHLVKMIFHNGIRKSCASGISVVSSEKQ